MIKAYSRASLLAVILFISVVSFGQPVGCPDPSSPDCCPGFATLRQEKRANVNISTHLKGYLEYTPAGYDPNGSTLYPLIIYFHGVGEGGTGSNTDLCELLSLYSNNLDNNPFDIPLPERVERNEIPTVSNNGTSYNYIILSPQYQFYNYPTFYPSATDVAAMIAYAIQNYKVDPTRIYLTGMSSGANMVMEYAAASVTNAQLPAAIALSSLCSSVGQFPNGPANIANANLPVWAIHCLTDDFPNNACPDTLVNNWINRINNNVPPPTVLAKKTTLGAPGQPGCSTFGHNTWNLFYDPAYTVDGLNVYQWFIQYQRPSSPLPANLRNYAATLRNSKVYVEWVTTSEQNTDRFVLERSTGAGQFREIASVTASGTSSVEKKYVLIDEQPQRGANLYRLVLINKDGQREYFDIKRISLPNAGQGAYVNIPVPVRGTLNVYVSVERTQEVSIVVHDLQGKILHRVNRTFAPGVSGERADVTGLATGTYFVKVEGETFRTTRKIIVE